MTLDTQTEAPAMPEETPSTEHLKKADDAAFRMWLWKIYKRGRKPEGTFDGDSGKFVPTARESEGGPRAPRYFQSWVHICALGRKARKGLPVPADIEESWRTEYGKINAHHMKKAVDAALRAESEAHSKAQKKMKALEESVVARTTESRLADAKKRLASLEAKTKKLESRLKALETRKSRVRRSIGALERSAAKKGTS